MYSKDIQLQTVEPPRKFTGVSPVFLSDATMLERKNKVLARMNEEGFDAPRYLCG
ncbi:Uncharacterised protein [Raoultella terrigena]|uniref:Uncharacterized protein n=1 Tax=Raoultella terrigena TaxID=577 RepID=A0A485BGX0_RAOTE|nr:Uncharacterised protein [Raoultella terrigena]